MPFAGATLLHNYFPDIWGKCVSHIHLIFALFSRRSLFKCKCSRNYVTLRTYAASLMFYPHLARECRVLKLHQKDVCEEGTKKYTFFLSLLNYGSLWFHPSQYRPRSKHPITRLLLSLGQKGHLSMEEEEDGREKNFHKEKKRYKITSGLKFFASFLSLSFWGSQIETAIAYLGGGGS
jgi:hypothetical protein